MQFSSRSFVFLINNHWHNLIIQQNKQHNNKQLLKLAIKDYQYFMVISVVLKLLRRLALVKPLLWSWLLGKVIVIFYYVVIHSFTNTHIPCKRSNIIYHWIYCYLSHRKLYQTNKQWTYRYKPCSYFIETKLSWLEDIRSC